MSRFCGTCGALLDDMALATGRCRVCGAPIHDARNEIAEAATQPLGGPLGPPPPLAAGAPAREAAWPPPARRVPRASPEWLHSARAIGKFLLFALLVAVLLALLVQHVGVQFILAPSASSSSSSSANSDSSSQSFSGAAPTATATTTHGATPTPRVSPTPGPSPTATPVPGTLDVNPKDISLAICSGAQTQFSISNTGGVPFSWTATYPATGYTLDPKSGTLDGGKQQTVMVTLGVFAAKGTITVMAPSARNSPQTVTISCTL
jgi:hypothetical protein